MIVSAVSPLASGETAETIIVLEEPGHPEFSRMVAKVEEINWEQVPANQHNCVDSQEPAPN